QCVGVVVPASALHRAHQRAASDGGLAARMRALRCRATHASDRLLRDGRSLWPRSDESCDLGEDLRLELGGARPQWPSWRSPTGDRLFVPVAGVSHRWNPSAAPDPGTAGENALGVTQRWEKPHRTRVRLWHRSSRRILTTRDRPDLHEAAVPGSVKSVHHRTAFITSKMPLSSLASSLRWSLIFDPTNAFQIGVDPTGVILATGHIRHHFRFRRGFLHASGEQRLGFVVRYAQGSVIIANDEVTRMDDHAVDRNRNVDLTRTILVGPAVCHA